MPWGIAAAAVIGAYGASEQAGAAKDGANAQAASNAQGVAEQRRQYDQSRQDQQPWMQAGGWALGQQQNFLKGDYSDALKSPDYTARMEWGQKALDRGASARGGMFSGGHQA